MEREDFKVGDLVKFNETGKSYLYDHSSFPGLKMDHYYKVTYVRSSRIPHRKGDYIICIEGYSREFHCSFVDRLNNSVIDSIIESLGELEEKLKK